MASVLVAAGLVTTSGPAAPASAAVAPASGPVSPMVFHRVRGFYYEDECNSYGYAHYGSPDYWFCVRDYNPNDLPWALWAEEWA